MASQSWPCRCLLWLPGSPLSARFDALRVWGRGAGLPRCRGQIFAGVEVERAAPSDCLLWSGFHALFGVGGFGGATVIDLSPVFENSPVNEHLVCVHSC